MITVLSLIFAAALQAHPAGALPDVRVARQTYAMGTLLAVEVAAAERADGIEAIEAVFLNTRRLEAVLSSWTAESEIGRINAAPVGVPVAASAELITLLQEAASWASRTGGAFDPGVGALTDAWDMRGPGRLPGDAELRNAVAATGLRHFQIDAEAGVVTRLHEHAWIDTGGFGKGVALRQAREILQTAGISSGSIDFGGQLLVFGEPEEGGSWTVGVARPDSRHEPHTELRLDSGSVSTSSQSERFVSVEGRRIGHIVDPRSGLPLAPWGSVTVVATDPVAADVLSTALLVMGPVAGMQWAEAQEEVGVLFLEENEGSVTARWNHVFARHQTSTTAPE